MSIRQYPPEPWRWQFHCNHCAMVGWHWTTIDQARTDERRHVRETHPEQWSSRSSLTAWTEDGHPIVGM